MITPKVICPLILILISSSAFSFTPRQEALKKRVNRALSYFDIKNNISNEDFILSMYQQILDYNPTQVEFLTMKLLLEGDSEEGPLDRSHFVEQLLVIKEGGDLSWESVERNAPLLESLNLKSKPTIGVYDFRPEHKEIEKSEKKKYLAPISHKEEYQVFHGFLHAHSELSDGRGEAAEAYTMAKFEAGLDYFALTDHSELLHFWPWNKKYKQLRKQADRFNEDGRFTALYGYEWSHPLLGHFNVVNTKKFTSAIIKPTMKSLMNWLAKKEGAFGRFNHPGRVNWKHWPYEFAKLKVYNNALKNVVGIEMWNKGDGIGYYLNENESFKEGHNFLDNANLNGWFVGTVGGQDNHDADWGLRNDYRVGVWSKGLSRSQIVESYFGRRTFATEDKNAWLSFKINGAQMGSRLKPGTYELEISFGDDDGEEITEVKLVKRGQLIKEYHVTNNQTITGTLTGSVDDYFYVIAKQKDGNLLLSSPIWIVP